MMASALCKIAGKDIPIYPGIQKPLLIEQQQPLAQQAEKLKSWEHEREFAENEAVEFLRQTIRSNPGEIMMLTIGPLTNIGLLFSTDPEIPSLLKGLVLMCGAFSEKQQNKIPVEWNSLCDPHASAIVFGNHVGIHRSIGLDVTTQVTMEADRVREAFRHDLLRPVLDFAEVWFRERDIITFHDPLAATTIFDDSICTFEKGRVDVDIVHEKTMGMTRWKPDQAQGRHEVAVNVDSDRFFKEYFSVFK
jgi:inosine-uridine nucleoside N-ribohydrolase